MSWSTPLEALHALVADWYCDEIAALVNWYSVSVKTVLLALVPANMKHAAASVAEVYGYMVAFLRGLVDMGNEVTLVGLQLAHALDSSAFGLQLPVANELPECLFDRAFNCFDAPIDLVLVHDELS
jgi:hypothetical protein